MCTKTRRIYLLLRLVLGRCVFLAASRMLAGHDAYRMVCPYPLQETHFQLGYEETWQESFADVDLSCTATWGPTENPIYLINHFLYLDFKPEINSWEVLFNRTYECWAVRSWRPKNQNRFTNILLVDRYEEGQALDVIRWLNDNYNDGSEPPELTTPPSPASLSPPESTASSLPPESATPPSVASTVGRTNALLLLVTLVWALA